VTLLPLICSRARSLVAGPPLCPAAARRSPASAAALFSTSNRRVPAQRVHRRRCRGVAAARPAPLRTLRRPQRGRVCEGAGGGGRARVLGAPERPRPRGHVKQRRSPQSRRHRRRRRQGDGDADAHWSETPISSR
jgi:hypothetical protein